MLMDRNLILTFKFSSYEKSYQYLLGQPLEVEIEADQVECSSAFRNVNPLYCSDLLAVLLFTEQDIAF